MAITANAFGFLAHHQTDFAVGLVTDHAVNHMGADFFQGARPGDIGFLIETRLQLEKHRHFFACFGGAAQRLGRSAKPS